MANVRDSDTSLWLHNKLGTSGDLWSGGSICSQLSQDVLRNIKECFIDLQAQVKLKLLLSFLHIPMRNVEEWRVELEEILELAAMDSDQWVSMLAELLKVYPATGTINMDIEENTHVFTDLVAELKRHTKKTSDLGMIPLECLYLNKNALSTVVGQPPQPVKHFTLKRKPKSAALRAELIQKSSDAANNLKKSSVPCGVPIRSRSLAKRMDDSTPLKGLPSRVPGNSFRSPAVGIRRLSSTSLPSRPMPKTPAGRKDGGIKFLEITEQPIGFGRESKRRKKLQDESGDGLKKEKESQPGSSSPTSQSTPEYAAGLVAPTITPQLSTSAAPLTSMPGSTFPSSTSSTQSLHSSSPAPSTITTTATTATLSSQPIVAATTAAPSSTATPPVTVSTQVRETVQHFAQTSTAPTIPPSQPQQQQQQPSQTTTVLQPMKPIQPTVKQPQPSPQSAPIQVQPQQQRKGLSLTREQMQEAQEMFRTANKVTRPEKALILGFMAGARDNPCPHLGNIVTIKLSESQESLKQPDGTFAAVVVEMHFQMNYNTGEWKRVRKVKRAEE